MLPPPVTIITPYRGGMNLKKLGLLSDLAKDIRDGKLSLEDACLEKLDTIDDVEEPFPAWMVLIFGWIACGAGLATVLGGNGWYVKYYL